MKEVEIHSQTIQLDQFLKWAGIVSTGGEAKLLIQAGKIKVNEEVQYRRAHKLKKGDTITRTDTGTQFKVISD